MRTEYKAYTFRDGEKWEATYSSRNYDQARKTKKMLAAALAIEEAYAVAMEGFLDFDLAIHALASRQMVESTPINPNLAVLEQAMLIGRHLAGALTLGRQYEEHCNTQGTVVVGRAWLKTFESLLLAQEDANPGFGLVRKIRNSLQHAGPVVRSISHSFFSIGDHPDGARLAVRTSSPWHK